MPAATGGRNAALHGGPDVDTSFGKNGDENYTGGQELKLGMDSVTLDNLDLDSILGGLQAHEHGPHGQRQRPQAQGSNGGLPGFDPRAAQKVALARQDDGPSPQRASAKHSLAHGPALVGGRCGERLQFTMTAVTEKGKVCDTGNTRVAAHVTGLSLLSKAFPEPRPWIEDRKDGTYIVQFVCATPGQYHVSAYIDGILLPMCPVTIDVTPGPPSPMHCDVTGEGARCASVGGFADFTIQARDEFGNACVSGGHRIGIRAIGHAKLHEVADNEDGTYLIAYSVPEWAYGSVQLEVLLDGVPIKDSPVIPSLVNTKGPEPKSIEDLSLEGGFDSAAVAQRLKWLKENPPKEVPDLPEIPMGAFGGGGGMLDAGALSAGGGGAAPFGGGGDGAAARLAWRAADEWKRLAEMRDEMSRTRDGLMQYQNALLAVGDSVHKEFNMVKDTRRSMEAEKADLADVEARLDWLRGDLARQSQGLGGPAAALDNGSVGSPTGGAFANRDLDTQMASVNQQLYQLNDGIESKRQWMSEQEERGGPNFGGYGGMSPMQAEDPPYSYSPGASPGMSTQMSRGQGRLKEVLPPPAPPPVYQSPVDNGSPVGRFNFEPAEDFSPERTLSPGLGLSQGGVLRQPPPPPSPPPAYGTNQQSPGAASNQGASPEELGAAMRKLFSAFATSPINTPGAAARGGGKSGRMGMSQQDYIRMANAAQLRLPNSDLQDAFRSTVQRYGGSTTASGERVLAFEIFVELLVETARKRYGDLNDPEATAALFEEHLLPTARQLSNIEAQQGVYR